MRKIRWLQFIIILTGAGFFTCTSAEAETLYVFYPSLISAASLQKELNEACPGIELMVFGRFKDFEDRVANDSPDAVLTKPPVIEQIGGYTVRFSGSRKGNTSESYIFLSVEKKIAAHNLSGNYIGIFDILGRKGMDAFISKFLSPVPKLRRVSKMEDLLQLLTFNMVEAILIPEAYAEYYKKISKLNFVITPFPAMKSGILSLGVRQGKDAAQIISTLKSLNEQYMSLLEVEQWK
jgi:hypothetical protein